MNYNKTAIDVYRKFSSFEGNQHIASEFALKCVLKLVVDFKIKRILEIGLGIGCIVDAVLEFSKEYGEIDYYGTENNDFCLQQLKHNVNQYNKIKLYSDVSKINPDEKFDFIIIDGKDESLKYIQNLAYKNTLIFIEGGRADQVVLVKNYFPNAIHVQLISDYKNPIYGPFKGDKWCSGGQLIFPYPSMSMKIYFWKEKIATYLKRKKRNKQ